MVKKLWLPVLLFCAAATPVDAQAPPNQSVRAQDNAAGTADLPAYPIPTPTELLARAKAAQKAQDARGWKYTYREDNDTSDLEKDGKATTTTRKTYEHIMLEGAEYKKLLLIDGQPLDTKTQKKVDADLEKARAERKKHGFGPAISRSFNTSDLDLVDRFFEKKVIGEETVAGRKAWRMESEPKAGNYKPADKRGEQALATRQILWFDQQDGMEIKEHIEFIRAATGFQPGSTIDMESVKIGDDWLTDNVDFRFDVKLMLGIHPRAKLHSHLYDYKRFAVDSRLTSE